MRRVWGRLGAPGHARHVGAGPCWTTPTSLIFVFIRSPDQTLATSLPSPPLPSATRALLRRIPATSAMSDSVSESDLSGSVDWGVIPCGLEEAMAVRIALRRSREESSRPRDGSVHREALALAHPALGSGTAGSSRSRQPEHRSFPITGPTD